MIYGIDGGTNESAIVAWDGKQIRLASILENIKLLELLRASELKSSVVVLERIESRGGFRGGKFNNQLIGQETIDTIEWNGRFREACEHNGASIKLVFRREVKLHHCGSMKAKDSNLSQALRDKYGDKKTGATKPLRSHMWQAFACLTVITETTPELIRG